ncbi:putative cadherin [Caerostris darwini]|uniref:Cadherin n=1 Tax=Caerostris darwini TaxID=1538125 RepID=A0AAV4PS48_9ARAC|nr:putative cadherin [Caerostris darwini]
MVSSFFAQVYYAIESKDQGDKFFSIDRETGEIYTRVEFDREEKQAYAILVRAEDGAASDRPNMKPGEPNSVLVYDDFFGWTMGRGIFEYSKTNSDASLDLLKFDKVPLKAPPSDPIPTDKWIRNYDCQKPKPKKILLTTPSLQKAGERTGNLSPETQGLSLPENPVSPSLQSVGVL